MTLTDESMRNAREHLSCALCAHLPVCDIAKLTAKALEHEYTEATQPFLWHDLAQICKHFQYQTKQQNLKELAKV